MLFSLKLAIFSKRSTCLDENCHEEIFKIIIFQLEKWTWNFIRNSNILLRAVLLIDLQWLMSSF